MRALYTCKSFSRVHSRERLLTLLLSDSEGTACYLSGFHDSGGAGRGSSMPEKSGDWTEQGGTPSCIDHMLQPEWDGRRSSSGRIWGGVPHPD